ncbi:MAG TPA: polyribonucleotide nucleotidyltransferase [Planctomycetes bacterium]|nr:polyribonucleotide nucleotidyltransferase [Planctomycetota bacterium]
MPNPAQSPVSVSCELGGKTLTIETGRIARQAHGSVTIQYGETVVLVTAATGPSRPGQSFFPLTVDYRESTTAAGKFPGGFFKREGRPSTKEILAARCIDRPIRPLFPDGFMDDVMISCLVWSFDNEHDPDVLAMIGASAALSISEIPWAGPIGACRVGRVEGKLVINPTYEQREESDLDLVMAASKDAITMVEAGADELAEDEMIDALFAGHEACTVAAKLIDELVEKVGPIQKQEWTPPAENEELKAKVFGYLDKVMEVSNTPGKHNRKAAISKVRDQVIEELTAGIEDEAELKATTSEIKGFYEKLSKQAIRQRILQHKVRDDGRDSKTVRPIHIEVGVMPRTHGSVLFTRGETQAMVSLTLGSVMDDQRVEGLTEPTRKKFMLHYNFPSYCVGEAWPNRGPKRREIGHGALAERSLQPLVPPFEEFPYTIRIRSDITESNGSSSMASVCGGTLAMMDGGVRIRRPVAGIAMGLISEGDTNVILSDILGSEDHAGDMDFKVAGTQKGITALQMDIKIDGLTRELMSEALEQAREGRIHILKEMLSALQAPREDLSDWAPKIVQVPIDVEKIGALIGPGGSVIRKLQEETNTKIGVEEDKALAVISGGPDAKIEMAEQLVRALTSTPEVGARYTGRVVSIRDFGCFVELMPGLEALCHVSELSTGYVESVEDVVSMDQEIEVEVINVDQQGRLKVSKKAVDIAEGRAEPEPERSDGDRDDDGEGGSRGGRGRGGDRGGRGRGGDRGGRGRGGDRGGRGRSGDRGGRGGHRREGSGSRSSD